MSDFAKFSQLIHQRFNLLSKQELFVTAPGDDVWSAYIAAFPTGTNPIFRERTEHDCSCCKNFVRNIGNLVAIEGGKLTSIWDVDGAESPYREVAAALHEFVTNQPITGVFRTKERSYGAEKTFEQVEGSAKTWHHFHGAISAKHHSATPGEAKGAIQTTFDVFKRGMQEITMESIDTVLELIQTNALYRGEEHAEQVRRFRALKVGLITGVTPYDTYLWQNVGDPAARLKNSVIGTLLVDLSNDVEMEQAVKSFEGKVAPTNYKRPTALITKGMVDQAMKTIAELDLEGALQRRFAKLSDISINEVLWVDGKARGQLRGGVAGLLMSAVVSHVDQSKAQAITIDDFMSQIVPSAGSMDVFVKNAQQGNFMSLTAPVLEDSGRLFRWNNDFGWSYDGNVTDSIKEKVRKAGGNVTNARLRVSLAWFNLDDLDIHCVQPDGTHIFFGNKCGVLDVDMNAGSGTTRSPVENLSWETLRDGTYRVHVNQYSRRETSNVGFELEVESAGTVHQYVYKQAVAGNVAALHITIRNGAIAQIWVAPGLTGGGFSADKWGVKTETFVPVTTLMRSPNHWDGNSVGNKHWFFILKDCVNPEPTRGIYNEHLRADLEKHRKVFEVLGNKTLCPPSADQLSGVGFSSSRGDEVIVRVISAASTKLFNVKF